jgi:hypothetical protein
MQCVAIALPASPEARQQLRPIGHRTDQWPQMIAEHVTLAPMLDDSGWEASTCPEPQRHPEGLAMGFASALGRHLLHHTQRIQVGPLGSGLPPWSPLRLAVETAWLAPWRQGRTSVGFARGYPQRGYNLPGQVLGGRGLPVRGMRRISTLRRCARTSLGASSGVGPTRPSPTQGRSITSPMHIKLRLSSWPCCLE